MLRDLALLTILVLAGSCDSCEPPELSYSDEDLSANVTNNLDKMWWTPPDWPPVPHPVKIPKPDLAADAVYACVVDSDCYRFFNRCGECACHVVRADTVIPSCPLVYNDCPTNPCIGQVAVCSIGVCALVKP